MIALYITYGFACIVLGLWCGWRLCRSLELDPLEARYQELRQAMARCPVCRPPHLEPCGNETFYTLDIITYRPPCQGGEIHHTPAPEGDKRP